MVLCQNVCLLVDFLYILRFCPIPVSEFAKRMSFVRIFDLQVKTKILVVTNYIIGSQFESFYPTLSRFRALVCTLGYIFAYFPYDFD